MGAVAKITDEGLTPREAKYAIALIAHGGNRKQAYLDVYGSCANITSEAAKIANRPHVMAYAKQLLSDELEIAKTDALRVIAETSRIAFSDPLSIFDEDEQVKSGKLVIKRLRDIPRGIRASIKKIKQHAKGIEVEFYDKTRVLQDLQRRFGLLGDRKDSTAQQVHIHLDMRGDGPIDMVGEVPAPREAIDVTPAEPEPEPELEF